MKKFAAIAIAAASILVTTTGCAMVTAEPSEIGVHVSGGFLLPSDKTIVDCVEAGKYASAPLGHDFYVYPAGERTYKFSNDQGSDGVAVQIVKGNIPLTITGVVTFRLNPDCNTLKEFHRLIGSKIWNGKHAYIENDSYEGWDAMLDTYIEQAIQSAATAASSQIEADYLQIYNGAGRGKLEEAMRLLLPQYVKTLSGGDYFDSFSIVVNKPTIDRKDILDAIASKTVAELENEAQKQKNQSIATELESIKTLVAVLGSDGYIAYVHNQLTKQQLDLLSQAIAKGEIQILPVPENSSLTLPTTKK